MSSDEIRNISNRPKELYEIPYYNGLPNLPIEIEIIGMAGEFFNKDILGLSGVQPIENAHLDTYDEFISMNPSKGSLEIYKKKGTLFQGVQVIVSAYGFRKIGGILHGKPYNISIFPMSKRGQLTSVDANWIEQIDLESINEIPKHYRGFNPFFGSYGFYVANYSNFSGIESDMIGFVMNTYFLSTSFNPHDISTPFFPGIDMIPQVKNDYRKYRKDWYFKKFDKIKPRKIWGCDSPIELFLLQAMDSLELAPEIQTIITHDGDTIPSLHKLWENSKSRKRIKIITEADFYFPEKKVAIFCDSKQHHSSISAIEKDKKVDDALVKIGIQSIRISGQDIVSNPINCAEKIKNTLDNLK